MLKMTNKIWVTFSFAGLHKYPDAPDRVAYLRHPHRHIFHVKLCIDVKHDDREIEFIMLKEDLQSITICVGMEHKLNNMSCEMIADWYAEYVSREYDWKGRELTIEVSEDGENGSYSVYLL